MQGSKRGLSASERADLWQRWKSGQSLSDIGRALGKPGSVFGLWLRTEAFRPPLDVEDLAL